MSLDWRLPFSLLCVLVLTTGCGGGGTGSSESLTEFKPIVFAGQVKSRLGSTASAQSPLVDVQVELSLLTADEQVAYRVVQRTREAGEFLFISPDFSDLEVGQRPSVLSATFSRAGFTENHRIIRNLRSGAEYQVTQFLSSEILAVPDMNGSNVVFGAIQEGSGAQTSFDKPSLGESVNRNDLRIHAELSRDALASNVGSVSAGLAWFDPNFNQQVLMFPGDFSAQGAGEQATGSVSPQGVSTGANYRLNVAAFAYLSIVDQDNQLLSLKTTAEPAVIYISIPQRSFHLLQRDHNGSQNDGWQVPIYVFNQGWRYGGDGTLVTRENDTFQTLTDYSLLQPGRSDTTPVFAKIQLQPEQTLSRWLSVAYPVLPSEQIQKACLRGVIQYENTEDETFSGDVLVRLPDKSVEKVYVDKGNFTLQTFMDVALKPVERMSTWPLPGDPYWAFELFNPRLATTQDVKGDLKVESLASTTDDCAELGVVNLPKTWQCVLDATIQTNGVAFANKAVSIEGRNHFHWHKTSAAGEINLPIACNQETTLRVAGVPYMFNANNVLEAGEARDIDGRVELVITQGNAPPRITDVSVPERVFLTKDESRTVRFAVSVVDEDGPFPLQLNFDFGGAGTDTQTINITESHAVVQFEKTVSGEQVYPWRFVLQDGAQAQHEASGELLSELGNRAPAIHYVHRAGQVVGEQDQVRISESAVYHVSAFDADGDTLSYEWLPGTGACQNPSTAECALTTRQLGTFTFTVRVSDLPAQRDPSLLSKATEKSFTVEVRGNQAPAIESLTVDPKVSMADENGNAEPITLQATVTDDYSNGVKGRPSLGFQWFASGPNLAQETPVGNTERLVLVVGRLPGRGEYTLRLVVSDNDALEPKKSTQSIKITVGDGANLDVVIQ